MKRRILLFLFIVIQIVYQVSGVFVGKKAKIDVNKECKRIKCPPVSEPLCVRLKYVTSALQSKTVYVVMINRCEMKYVNCHEGAETKVLPMENCDHGKNVTSDLNTLVERRRKMDFKVLSSKNKDKVTQKNRTVGLVSAMPKLVRHKRKAVSNKKKNNIRSDKQKHKVIKKQTEMEHINEVKRQLFKNSPITKNDKSHSKILRKKKKGTVLRNSFSTEESNEEQLHEIDNVPPLHVYTKDNNGEQDSQDADGGNEPGNGDKQEDVKDDNDAEKLKNIGTVHSGSVEHDEYDIKSEEFARLEHTDLQQYKADCPKICPARGLMLCGRCKDGIYRTFLSTCHMRMFDCGHPDEKLTLVSRYPCAMSGPYLEDLRVPKGLVDEPHDEDVVLRFLKCHEYHKKKLRPYSKLNCTFDGEQFP